jgi:hypothetical protein
MMLLSIVFVWFLIPETKGIPLESMDRLFGVKPVRKAHGFVHAENIRAQNVGRREELDRHDADRISISLGKEDL